MKDYRTIIDNDTVEMFCTTLYDCLADSFEGCLLDNYFFDIGKIKVSALPPIAKRDLIAELKCKGFCDGMIHTALQCRLEDLKDYVNVWKYVAYILAVELMERL